MVEEDIDLSFLVDERTEDPCESKYHDIQPEFHGGAGEWLIRVEYQCCSGNNKTLLVCDKNLRELRRFGGYCRCGHDVGPDEWEEICTVLGRKGVDF